MASLRFTSALDSLQDICMEEGYVCIQDDRSAFYEQLRMDVLSRLTYLPQCVLLRLRDICSPQLWQELSAKDRRIAGKYFYWMVSSGEFYRWANVRVILQCYGKTNIYSVNDVPAEWR